MRVLTKALIATTAVVGMAGAAAAADLIVTPPPVIAPAPIVVGGGWDGFYIGVHGGYGWGTADHDTVGGGPVQPGGNDLDLAGWLGGVQAGVNFYLTDSVIGGVEADLSLADITGTDSFGNFGDITHTINWQGSIRARLGIDGGPVLPYITGGLAIASATRETDFGGGASATATHVGWTVGAGVELLATDNISVGLEYRYTDFGAQDYNYGSVPSVALTSHQVRGGLNFHF